MANVGQAGKFNVALPAKLRKAMTFSDALTGKRVSVAAGQAALTLGLPKASAVVLTPAK